MVGRQPELSRLRAVWQDVNKGSTRLVLVAGEPGVGKTRLAAELAGTAEADGARVLVGRCRREAEPPYGPFVEALGRVLNGRSDTALRAHVKRHGAGIVRLFPELAPRLDQDLASQRSNSRAHLFGSVAGAINDLDGRKPLLLVLEDLHWATRSTALLLEHIVRESSGAPLLIVGTYRDAAIHPSHPLAEALDHLGSDPHVERLVLANLSPQAVTALLVDRAAVAGKAAAALALELWRTTEGHPLVLTEFVRDLVGHGALSDGTVSSEIIAKVGMPHDVIDLVGRRMGRPGSATRSVLEAASVVGLSFSSSVVAAVTEQKDDEVRAALRQAADVSLIVDVDAQAGHYRFVHDLVREAVLGSVPANRQVRVHHQLATALGGCDGAPQVAPAVLVHHLAAATPVGRSPEAVSHARQAGRQAMDILAFEEAAGFFGQALALLGGNGSSSTRVHLLSDLGEANHLAGEPARARQSYLQAAAVARAGRDGPGLGRAVLGLSDVLGVWGADGLLIGLLEQAVAANPEDPSLRAKLIGRLAQARGAFDSPDERKAQSDVAWELAWDSRDPDTMRAVLRARHEALSAPDDLEDRVEIDGELVAMAIASTDHDLGVLAAGWRLVDVLEQGHLVDADRDRETHAHLAQRLGDPRHLRDAAAWSAMRALVDGRTGPAATDIDQALGLGEQIHDPDAPSIYWTHQLGLLLDWGDDGELDGLVDVWHDLVRSHDCDLMWRAQLALLLARIGRLEEADEELDDLLVEECTDLPLNRDWLATVAAIGEVAAMLDDSRAPLLARMLTPYGRRLIVLGRGLVCRGSVSRVVGQLWSSAGSWAEAERHFQAALSAHDRMSSPPLLARARADFGRALARQPGGSLHLSRARSTLCQAAEEAEAAGMVRLAGELRAALQALPTYPSSQPGRTSPDS